MPGLARREHALGDLQCVIGRNMGRFIKQQNIPKIAVANQLDIIPTTLNRYYKQSSLQFSILWRISKAINYNMIMDLGERLKIDYETQNEKKLKEELAQKNELIKELEFQLKVYQSMKG